ncbi:MAG: zf-HC2 domain-containing protein [Candidatus Marinimicrobia bacterium]|jgi:hypothetical protein|nr:zf-HC2 domain-containing protein [Candidatus Neomarinimicrobiota bacterium]MBT3631229.1 zf-HC2 domain-containing protein [Candidatus Neomarinimicrobiota bacterium]MBT3824737.1 zf-HC2 domain-containing protein [Candidatus Neomarinimicrobiota bacterium]MBT4131661.1 zf-HC2 domain-containing protein [Candidatus Neomarinimicrobiota bacterium]MBT4296130.1 zf-HC2 domain-containing protein [Candidatus Neomarinimicrobiota bacterium]
MKHAKWIRSIHLLRGGELNPEEEQALSAHLSGCKHCSVVYEKLQLDWIKVMGEIGTEPVLPDSERLSDDILSAVYRNELQSASLKKTPRSEREPFFLMPGFRFGLQVASLIFLAIFFIEQYQITHSVHRLEIQLQTQNTQPRYARLNMIPPTFKKQLLVIVKEQLEKRGLPTNRIEEIVHSLETGSINNETLSTRKRDLTRVEKWIFGQGGISKLKHVDTYWRQP